MMMTDDRDPQAQMYEIVQKEMMEERRKREIFVPTKDDQVKAILRSIGEPAILFGEDGPARRERLRNLILKAEAEGRRIVIPDEYKEEAQREVEMEDKLYYTEGTPELLQARMKIAANSLKRGGAGWWDGVMLAWRFGPGVTPRILGG
ncbi:hypothetical protein PAPYR_10437 [Paratrimastix pyriformis]|uniref:Pre-mRNA processing factor 4 (PRP4)-like domain-containing protein n=1 Tax=Paratrimastix pyriformis TaxID=342808 RepID=A0ABQ8UBS9_9EUKA|nr:hypothetical protein PAPYR_10437 [Paratrimastix pyriformis]